ncbi:hypothetical protein F5Y02DRAFT_368234 [Annulohypoxylon stygium]|nr:hypothetical protein F5Y02DRAFT_368234 [Annulohypoxylon stygium]
MKSGSAQASLSFEPMLPCYSTSLMVCVFFFFCYFISFFILQSAAVDYPPLKSRHSRSPYRTSVCSTMYMSIVYYEYYAIYSCVYTKFLKCHLLISTYLNMYLYTSVRVYVLVYIHLALSNTQ